MKQMLVLSSRGSPVAGNKLVLSESDWRQDQDSVSALGCKLSSHSNLLHTLVLREEQAPSHFLASLLLLKSHIAFAISASLRLTLGLQCSPRSLWPPSELARAPRPSHLPRDPSCPFTDFQRSFESHFLGCQGRNRKRLSNFDLSHLNRIHQQEVYTLNPAFLITEGLNKQAFQ